MLTLYDMRLFWLLYVYGMSYHIIGLRIVRLSFCSRDDFAFARIANDNGHYVNWIDKYLSVFEVLMIHSFASLTSAPAEPTV